MRKAPGSSMKISAPSRDEKYLNIDQSLKNYKTVEVKNFPLKEILEEK